jgi:hypothetical protein
MGLLLLVRVGLLLCGAGACWWWCCNNSAPAGTSAFDCELK